MPTTDNLQLKATPHDEDFAHKYTEEGQSKRYRKLLDNYFRGVESLVAASGLTKQNQPAGQPTNTPDSPKTGAGDPTLQAIEIGCGEGFSTQRLRAMLPDHVRLQASEFVADMVPRAQALNPDVPIIEESIYETTHADASFDLIFLLEVLEHLDYPDKALAELARILKPGGYLVLGVPREPLWCALNLARGKYLRHFGNTPGHLNHWPTFALKRDVRRHFGPILASRTPLPWTQVLAQKR